MELAALRSRPGRQAHFDLGAPALRSGGLRVAFCALLISGVLSCADDGDCETPRRDAPHEVYSLALHVHGSLSEGPASMAAHDAAARSAPAPVDVIWWTDHSWRIRGHTYVDRFGFEGGLMGARAVPRQLGRRETLRVDDEAGGAASPSALARLGLDLREQARVGWQRALPSKGLRTSVVETAAERAFAGRDSLLLAAASDSASSWRSVAVRLHTDRRRHVAPLAAGVALRLAVWPEALGEDARLVVTAGLSQQPGLGPARVEWVLTGSGQAGASPRPDVETREAPGGRRYNVATLHEHLKLGEWNTLELDLTQLAKTARLGGDDASLQQLAIRLDVRAGAEARVFVDEVEVERARMGEPLFEWQADHAEVLTTSSHSGHSIQHHVGQEISYSAHLNAYGSDVPLVDLRDRPSGLTPLEAVRHAHAAGGLVSLNHPLGVEFALTRPTTSKALARLEERMDDLARRRAHGADLIEVGYRARGRDLQAHLALWDRLSAAGVFVTGVGVSDTHDASRGWGAGLNNFVTWVYARSKSEADLIDGLRAGRAFFGDPTRFDGRIELGVPGRGDAGSVLHRSSVGDAVRGRVTGLREGQRIYWVEAGERRPAEAQPTSTQWEGAFRVAPNEEVTWVRLEVHDADGPVALSNPIYWVGADFDASSIPTARDSSQRGRLLHDWLEGIGID